MKVLLDIKDNRGAFFMELLNSLDYVKVLKTVTDEQKQKAVKDLADAFHEVHLHESGKRKLKKLKDLLDEL